MINKFTNIQIILNGKFQPLSADPNNLIELNTLLNKFQLFPKEVAEQRFEFTKDGQQKITVSKSLELASVNQKYVIQVRPDLVIYKATYESDVYENTFEKFLNILKEIQQKIQFNKASRLGLVITSQFLGEEIQSYKENNGLDSQVIEHLNRIVTRQKLDKISEFVNFVQTNEMVTAEAGAPENILNYTIDINTLSEKDTARFNFEDLQAFLNGASELASRVNFDVF